MFPWEDDFQGDSASCTYGAWLPQDGNRATRWNLQAGSRKRRIWMKTISAEAQPGLFSNASNPEYLFTKPYPTYQEKPYPINKHMMETNKFIDYICIYVKHYHPLKPLLDYQYGRFWRVCFDHVPKTIPFVHTCPPCLSTMTRRVYTSMCSFAFPPALVVSLTKNHSLP